MVTLRGGPGLDWFAPEVPSSPAEEEKEEEAEEEGEDGEDDDDTEEPVIDFTGGGESLDAEDGSEEDFNEFDRFDCEEDGWGDESWSSSSSSPTAPFSVFGTWFWTDLSVGLSLRERGITFWRDESNVDPDEDEEEAEEEEDKNEEEDWLGWSSIWLKWTNKKLCANDERMWKD